MYDFSRRSEMVHKLFIILSAHTKNVKAFLGLKNVIVTVISDSPSNHILRHKENYVLQKESYFPF